MRPIHPAACVAPLAIALYCLACTSPADPFTSGPGHASVHGLVTDSQGSPRNGAPVRVKCPGAPSVIAVTDSTGHFLVNLSISEDAFDASAGRPSCHFSEPATGVSRVQIDTLLGFAQGPVLVALQTVDLHEP